MYVCCIYVHYTNMTSEWGYPDRMSPEGGWFSPRVKPRGKLSSRGGHSTIPIDYLNPSNAKAIFVQSTQTQISF